MLDFLKNMFGGKKAAKTADLEAVLTSSIPGVLKGEAEFEAYNDGSWELEVEVEKEAGAALAGPITVHIDGQQIGELAFRGKEAELKLKSGRDTLSRAIASGTLIEVHGAAGAKLLSGTFAPDT